MGSHFYWEQGGLGKNVQSVLLNERYFALRMSPKEPITLFDVFKDPGCKKDLSADYPELIERAQTLFTSQHTENPWYVNLTAELRNQELLHI